MTLHRMHRLAHALALLLVLAACGTAPAADAPAQPRAAKKAYADLTVGFSQIGSESDWRTANTISIQETALELGAKLVFSDAQQKQENQIKALRSFIAQKVDVIGISPVVEEGWEPVFKEVKEAGIPLIVLDRRAAVTEDLYTTFIGSDFHKEGQRACEEMVRLLGGKGGIVELEGTVGSAPALDRKAGFHECLKGSPDLEVIAAESGDFTYAKGKEVMEALLASHSGRIGGLYAHNDDMALGAIEAIEAAGLRPGVDIKIVSIDAVSEAFVAMAAGKLNATVECNPLLGPQFFEAALMIANDEPVAKRIDSIEGVFRQETAAEELPKRKY
ncbi:MAG TPA: ABC transporter substrate-binding protein [Roseiflexaceae bacterium]|nr:ABC transporter substrate-binding protein [Roseiflexaceae bacterium]